jgi:pantoate--beta-alanine ligase
MRVLTTIAEMREASNAVRRGGAVVGLVPTMGALHDGHRSLVRAARESCGLVVVSVFVNPLQFGANEDLDRYPRTFAADCRLLEAEGVDAVFAPGVIEIYPAGAETVVDVPGIGGRLDGAARPGHFKGVATVVAKLFHIVQPDRAFFGQKDAAQVAVLRAMVRDLNFAVEIVVCPTVRDDDGLALSSRNRYLSAEERVLALALPRALARFEARVAQGEVCAGCLRTQLRADLEGVEGLRVEYAEVVDPATLEEVDDVRGGALVAVAAWVGGTRLIDNVVLESERR